VYIVLYMPNDSVSTTDIPLISAMLNIKRMTESNELKMAVHKNKVQTFPCMDWEKQTHWDEYLDFLGFELEPPEGMCPGN
jgi:hypothetical protein